MSGSIQSTGMFPSRKRRSGDLLDSVKDRDSKSVLRTPGGKKSREAGSGQLRSSAVALPSPGVPAGAVAPKSRNGHVQEAIHKEVQYTREGASKEAVPKNTLAVFRFVKEAFIIPPDIEKDHKYGPLSGVSYEMRLVSAFMAGLLEPRSEEAKRGVKMCLVCGKKGHFPRHCPAILLHE